jgi:hypothetical protein
MHTRVLRRAICPIATAAILAIPATASAAAPVIVSVSASPATMTVGTPVTFSVEWDDPGATVRAVICKTNAVSSGTCPGGAWSIGVLTTAHPATAATTPFQQDLGTQAFYAFVCDSAGVCSTGVAGSFTVLNRTPTLSSTSNDGPVKAGSTVTFSADWADPSDTVTALFCKTNGLTGTTCTGGAWATGSPTTAHPATATLVTTAADAGAHAYHAFVCDSQGACSSGVAGSFAVWQVVLTANRQLATVGEAVTLTATASANVFGTPWKIQIYDLTEGKRVVACSSGTVCTATDSRPNKDNQATLHEYQADVASNFSTPPPANIQAQSAVVPVAWGAAPALALTAAPAAAPTGTVITLTAASTRAAGELGFAVQIYDQDSGVRVVSCTTGQTCSVDVTSASAVSHTYIAYQAEPAATAPPPNVQATSNSATATWQTPPSP